MTPDNDEEAVLQLHDAYTRIRAEVAKAVVGQDAVIEQLLAALFAGGHCLLVGVPGLAKTLLVRSLASCLSLKFHRIQFTPDLMPSDITGTEVIQEDKATGTRTFRFIEGPVFANVVLADEINRTPPKTQAALLEAMQEHQITAAGQSHRLPEPFFVLATQNPIEHEGTYPLPEAQLDRFLFDVRVEYPAELEEREIVRRTTANLDIQLEKILDAQTILNLGRVVRDVPVPDYVLDYAVRLARWTRRDEPGAPDFAREYVSWGAGPRGSQYLVLAGKARAALQGRFFVGCDDIRAMAKPVLRHRLVMTFNAEADGITSDSVIERLIEQVPEDHLKEGGPRGGRVGLLRSSRRR